ncbi:MAG: choice-of-anchor D domain-containing protein, partial [Verrucomicrobia bacterium]|nr:choice-of-anchor D domain-containing protein [Verrucomicrobiota bacterium]
MRTPAPEIAVEQPAGTNLVDGASTVNFSAVLIGAYTTSTFTIRNSGTANLTGLAITINGANAGDFTVTANPTAPVAPGGSTTFTVRFAPAALGIRIAALHLASNDADENPFDINLTGTGTNVTSTIYGNYTPLPLNSSHAENYLLGSLVNIAADGELEFFGLDARATGPNANFGLYTDLGGNPDTLVATTGVFNLDVVGYIEKPPTAPVTLTAGNYWIMGVFNTVASIGYSNTVPDVVKYRSLTFTSSLPGSFGATTSFTGQKFNYYLKVGARVLGPEIAVEQPAGTGLTDGASTVSFGTVLSGSNTSRSFTVRNSGLGNLTGLGITIDGANPGDFTVTANPTDPVIPGGSTTFTVQFTPAALGTRTASLHLANNDADENPFDIVLSGIGTNTVASTYTLSATYRGWYNQVGAHTVGNLNYSTGFSTSSMEEFRSFFIFALPTLAAGETVVSAELRLANPSNGFVSPDPTETLQIHQVVTPISSLSAGTGGLAAFADLADGPVLGGPKTVSAADNGTTVVVPMNGAFNAMASQMSGTSIALGGAIATLSLTRVDEHVFSWTHDGILSNTQLVLTTATLPPAPEIAVEQPAGTDLTDGSSGIDFGSATLGGTPGSRTVTVRNLGTANLTGLAVTTDGVDAADFTLGALGATTLAPGASTTFTVTFAPGAAGARSAALHLASNDSDENPFDLTLTGHGNRNPVFAGYALATRTDQVLSIYPAKILARTSDPDGDAITLTRAFGPSAQGGTVALTTTVNYTPPLGFAGTDSFEVELTDARGAVVRGTITITVTAAPTGIGADGQNRT